MAAAGNIYSAFEAAFAAAGDKLALNLPAPGLDVTYGGLAEGAARYAGALAELGVAPGDRVTVQVEKSLDNLLLYLGVLKAGAVYQPLNTAYTAAELDYFIGDAKPAVVVGRPEDTASLATIAARHAARFTSLGTKGDGDLARLAATMPATHSDRAARKRRSGGAALHLRHHRALQGRHAHPRQSREQRPHAVRGLALHGG